MPDLRFLVVPGVLLAAVVGYVAANPTGAVVEEPATATTEPTATPRPTYTPTATPTPIPSDALLPGLSGRLTYRADRELVTLQFPDAIEISRHAMSGPPSGTVSSDGLWRYVIDCMPKCQIVVSSTDGQTVNSTGGGVGHVEWAPAGHALAFIMGSGDAGPTGSPSQDLTIIDDPAAGGTRFHKGPLQTRVALHDDAHFLTFAWIDANEILAAVADDAGSRLVRVALDGSWRTVGRVPSHIQHFYPSPDRTKIAFTQASSAGWHLYVFDIALEALTDLGNMGSDGPGATPVAAAPDGVKSPMYIAWSPDGAMLAFGGGFEPPYTMNVVDLATGAVIRVEFESGYPGEIRWSPDGTRIAVSTYDIERTHHETWVIDPRTGEGQHLTNGCVIVWSPDGQFLAVHGEDELGVNVFDLRSGAMLDLSDGVGDVPISWTD